MSRKDEELEARIKVLEEQVKSLKEHVTELGSAVNMNTDVFAGAFENVDARLAVMSRICMDLTYGGIAGVRVRGTRRFDGFVQIDFESYLAEYQAMLGFSKFVENLTRLISSPETPIEDAPETSMVFGGPGAQP